MMTTGGFGGSSLRMLDMCQSMNASDVDIDYGVNYERKDKIYHENVILSALAAAAATAFPDATGADNNNNDRAAAETRPMDDVFIFM